MKIQTVQFHLKCELLEGQLKSGLVKLDSLRDAIRKELMPFIRAERDGVKRSDYLRRYDLLMRKCIDGIRRAQSALVRPNSMDR